MDKTVAASGIRIPCKSMQDFFESWFNFLKPVHKLSNKEVNLLATIAKFRYEFSKKITDPELLDNYLMSVENKQKIREACQMTVSSFQVSMHKLKKNGAIIGNRINPKLIPNLSGNAYKLLLYFDIKNDGQLQD